MRKRHALAVDVTDLQRHHLAGAQSGAVGDRQRRLVLQVSGSGDQARDLLTDSTPPAACCGTCTGCILLVNSALVERASKKNFSPVIVALSEIGEMP